MKLPKKRGQPGLEATFIFLALDKPQDVRHLKSLNISRAKLNEACEIPVEVVDMLTARVGRFPQKKEYFVRGEKRLFHGATRVNIKARSEEHTSELQSPI